MFIIGCIIMERLLIINENRLDNKHPCRPSTAAVLRSSVLISSSLEFCPTGTGVENVSPSTPEEDDGDDASVNPPQPETDAWVPSGGSAPWITDRTSTRSNALADSVYKSFTSPSLLRVLMHTTQPMFPGTPSSEKTNNSAQFCGG